MAGRRFYRARAIPRLAAAGVLAVGAVACDGVPTEVELGQFAGGTDRNKDGLTFRRDSRLIGTWARVSFFGDGFGGGFGGGIGSGFGGTVTSRTLLTFRADGRFERRVISDDFSIGFSDRVVAQGTWRTLDGILLLDFDAFGFDGVQGSQPLLYAIERTSDGTRLLLDGELYVRVRGTF